MRRRSARLLGAVAFLAFASLGLPDGVLGVAWPSMRASFALPLSQLGVLLAAAMVGYLVSSFGTGAAVGRLGVGRLLAASGGVMVVSSLGYALAPAWPVAVGAGLLAGLGAGAIDAGINAYAAARFSPRLLSWLHASYGVGAMAGPLLMTGVMTAGLGWRWGYGLIGLALGGMTVAFVLTRGRWDAEPPPAAGGGPAGDDRAPAAAPAAPGPSLLETLGRPAVWPGLAFFFVYAGLEVTAGQWAYSLLTESRGVPMGAAGLWVTAYWGSLTVGRIVFGGLAARVPAPRLLRVAMILAPVAAAVVWADLRALPGGLGLALLGFALAPLYPLAVAATPGRVGEAAAAHVIGFQVAAAYLGTAALPGLTGVLARAHGLEVVGPVLLGSALAVLAIQELGLRPARPRERVVAGPAGRPADHSARGVRGPTVRPPRPAPRPGA